MHELKQLILSRIHDIKQLQNIVQDVHENSQKVHQLILKQRNGQQFRNRKQMEILSLANVENFQSFDEDVQNIVYEICGGYDQVMKVNGTERKGRIGDGRLGKWDGKDRLLKALKGFFHRNGYREKISYLSSIFQRNYGKMAVGLIFTLLSQWSKKKYLTVLSSKIKDLKSRYHHQLSYSPSTHKLAQSEPLSHKSTHLSSLTQKKSYSLLPSDNSHIQTNSSHTDILQKINKLSVGTVNSNKILTIYNRATLYGYFIEQMEEYYNLTGIEELDKNYVKMIPKRKMKENLCFVENMNRATEVLIQCSTNKQQRNIIKQYLCKYKLYKQEMRNIKIRKMQQKNNNSKNKSVRTMSDHIPNNGGKNNNPEKKLSVDLQIMRDNGSGQTYGFSIELQPNMSSSLLNLAKQNQEYSNLKQSIMKKIRHSEGTNENMYNFDKGSNKNKIKFPTLSRSMDKKQKTKQQYPEKAKLYRFPTNEDQTLVQKQQESKSSLFKFSQRQTIKGIIIKNFLSSRQKQKMTKLKQSQMQQLYIKNKQQQNTKRNGSKMQLQRKVIESVDLRSLRQKTKALLKNFRTIQNY